MIFSNKITTLVFMLLLVFTVTNNSYAIDRDKYITSTESKENFPIASKGKVASILMSDDDFAGVKRVVGHLQTDIFNVTNSKPNITMANSSSEDYFIIIIGTLGKSTIINKLVKSGKINAKDLKGKWEKFITQIVENPMPGVKKALVIAGSDKRGTIYGIYDLSNQIGVHPWHFWSDVPAKKQSELHVIPGKYTQGEPKVKYRGLFINDEAPALAGWAKENYGDFNAKFYDKVFELILRMKGNYMWPAMWSNAFNDDDPLNRTLADEYGIVMGTSHHEPMVRSQQEWKRFGKGEWNYNTNLEGLNDFWKKGIENMGTSENLVTIGMRGDGDEAMTEGTAIDLLEGVVKNQRKIIEEVTGKPAEKTPQIWALYKEVQDYYDQGMKVPDDVTLLLCDDNWGNIRKLPSLDAKPREGGYGIYYHFDYVGGPRNYKWLNTNQIERVWEQMHLAYEHNVDKVWIVNVGDIKPMEFPLQFWFDHAWNPEAFNADNLDDYYSSWTNDVFDGIETKAIANIMKLHTKYNARRKHELIDVNTYSLNHFNEANRVVEDYNTLAKQAQTIYDALPEIYKDTYYQVVLFPVLASANLNELYVSAAKNNHYAKQGRVSTNHYADKVRELFMKDRELTNFYHKDLANGKWNRMMSQTHIGYQSWQEPRFNRPPETFKIDAADDGDLGVSIENSGEWWSGENESAVLPTFDVVNNQTYTVELFNRGQKPFKYLIKSTSNWMKISEAEGRVDDRKNISISIDWSKAPEGSNAASVIVSGTGKNIPVHLKVNNFSTNKIEGFVENNGYITINAKNYSKKYEPKSFEWQVVDNLGKTGASVISLPVKKGRVELTKKSPRLTYNINLQQKGKVKVHLYFSPTINYANREGMYFGLSFDKQSPTLVNYDADPSIFNYNGKVPRNWHNNVGDNIKVITTEFNIEEAGNHTLNYYRVDEGLVLQRIIIETEASTLIKTYLGPPESKKID